MPEPGVVMASALTGDSTAATQEEAALYKAKCQELELQVEAQHKIISDFESAKRTSDKEIADLSAQLSYRDQVLIILCKLDLQIFKIAQYFRRTDI